jgi:hypothetical protein
MNGAALRSLLPKAGRTWHGSTTKSVHAGQDLDLRDGSGTRPVEDTPAQVLDDQDSRPDSDAELKDQPGRS